MTMTITFTEGRLEWGKEKRSEERVRERSEGKNLWGRMVLPLAPLLVCAFFFPSPPTTLGTAAAWQRTGV